MIAEQLVGKHLPVRMNDSNEVTSGPVILDAFEMTDMAGFAVRTSETKTVSTISYQTANDILEKGLGQ